MPHPAAVKAETGDALLGQATALTTARRATAGPTGACVQPLDPPGRPSGRRAAPPRGAAPRTAKRCARPGHPFAATVALTGRHGVARQGGRAALLVAFRGRLFAWSLPWQTDACLL
ncbi:MAG: hypothetical protein AUK30_09805 [Nitrospirae bacterium CG2_30_70_394]|nr:MAG: hypothetical protein AUK30_09805 [Nitrospirae bacterium CG2_30_70_394]PIW83491.1 MAG: hypothetical protein COZ96_03080 [Nitrospirae bacterium CG_4_8_14_3_um_filter_70_85]PJB95877.1 MAG: hypothetical protein CO080_05490 [Nitrospirae bacterium CG_4_9_14_0_8_um_filter_70_14]